MNTQLIDPSTDPQEPIEIPGSLKISSKLMSDYRLASAVTGDSDLIAVQGPFGEVELAALGAKGTVYNIRRSRSSDTGWEQVPLPNASPLTALAVGAGDTELVLFGIGVDESNPEIHFCTRISGFAWSSWTQSPVDPNLPPGLFAVRLVTGNIDDEIVLFAFLSGGPLSTLSLWSIPWQQPGAAWQYLGDVASTLGEVATFSGLGTGMLAFAVNAGDPTLVDLQFFPAASATPVTVLPAVMFTRLSVAAFGCGNSGVFLYNESWTAGTQNITFIDGRANPPEPVVIDTTIQCTQILGVDGGTTPLYLLMLDENGSLVVMHHDSVGNWSQPIPLGDSFSSICQAKDNAGLTEVFGFDLTGTLQRLSQQGNDSDDPTEWLKESIELPRDQITLVPSFGTTITVLSEEGNIMPFVTAQLYGGEVLEASIAGQSVLLNPQTPVIAQADARGVITVYTATDSLSTAKLRVVLGTSIDQWIQRNADTQSRVSAMTEQDVASLLPAQYQQDAAQVQQAIQASMSITSGQRSDPHSPRDSIAFSRAPQVHFRFQVRGGRATFTPLTAGEAAAFFAAPGDLTDFTSGFFEWFGDLVESAAEAVVSAFDYVVTTVANAVQATINCIVNGVSYVFSGLIQEVEQAFSFVESIFNSVEVFFENLFSFFGWLLTDAAQDIWNTKLMIEGAVTNMLPQLQQLAQNGAPRIAAWFAMLENQIETIFEQAIAAVGNDTFDYSKEALRAGLPGGITPEDITATADDNQSILDWLLDKLLSPLGDFDLGVALPASLLESIRMLLLEVSTLANSALQLLESEFETLADYFTQVAANPASFLQTTLKSLLTAIQQLVTWTIERISAAAQQVVAVAIELLASLKSDVLDVPIDGSFAIGLYNLFHRGQAETPTLLQFIALLCAFPSTILHRLITGSVPFTDRDVQAMQRSRSPRAEGTGNPWGLVASFIEMGRATFLAITDFEALGFRPGRSLSKFRNAVLLVMIPLITVVLALVPFFPPKSEGDWWVFSVAAFFVAQILFQMYIGFQSSFLQNLDDRWYGAPLTVMLGLCQLLTGIGAAMASPSVISYLLAVFPALPNLVKPIIQLLKVDPVILIVTEFVCYLGTGVVGAIACLPALKRKERFIMSSAQSDPTYETGGATRVYIINKSNTAMEIDASDNGIAYTPPTTPPWMLGMQWEVFGGATAIPPVPATGAVAQVEITDRSNVTVNVGSTYSIYFSGVNAASFRPYFEVHGVPGGSIIRPGIGLYNLRGSEGKWTNILPQVFEGTWTVSWVNPWYMTPATVTILYVPGAPPLWNRFSRLCYQFEAYGETDVQGTAVPADLPQGIVTSSSPHRIVGDSQPVPVYAVAAGPRR